jgi:hypothetical protein
VEIRGEGGAYEGNNGVKRLKLSGEIRVTLYCPTGRSLSTPTAYSFG